MRNYFTSIVPVLFLLAFLATACERELTVKLPPHTPKLVVHAYIQTGTKFSIAVGKTFAANTLLPVNDTYVTGASVTLYENGILRETLVYDAVQKRYVSQNTLAEAGKQYRVTVEAQGFETAEAQAEAPFAVNALSVQYLRNVRTTENGTLLSDVIFTFNDPPGERNYYLAEINRANPYSNYTYFCTYSYDPAIERYQISLNPFEFGNCIDNKQILYADKSFNGMRKEIVVSAPEDMMQALTDNTTGTVYRPFLKRSTISEACYQYIKSGIMLQNLGENPFSQPISTFTNVKNGYGLFTVYASVTDTLR